MPWLLLLLLSACTSTTRRVETSELPLLRLAPAALGKTWAVQQRLQFDYADKHDSIDALLEVDAQELRLALHRGGVALLRLRWDGNELQEQRTDALPDTLRAERVLSDLQMVFWPLHRVQSALPAGWTLDESDGARELRHGDELIARIEYPRAQHAVLTQQRYGYRLHIVSEPITP